jgi:hypothetical protein
MTENDPDDANHVTYGLVMPFIVTTSHGGPYEDKAFVAGWAAGWLDAMLATARPLGATIERYVPPGLMPQLELVAMHHGYTVTSEPWDQYPDDYTLATFAPALVLEEG